MRVRLLIAGRVQGVGFRYFAVRRAAELGIVGWVRNLADGRVEVVAQGPPEALDALSSHLWEGPTQAMVTGVEKSEISDETIIGKTFVVN